MKISNRHEWLLVGCCWAAAIALCHVPVSFASAASLEFASRTWNIKESFFPVGPGGNRFSASLDVVWSDGEGLHLTIHKAGSLWFASEVILDESLGYGTYMFQTSTRQDILNPYVTFGAFTWDTAGDDARIPDAPNREIDFEDSRWGNPSDPISSQAVVQPYFATPDNLDRITLPDLSQNAELTRFFTWSPGKIEFITLLGHHSPTDFPPSAIIHQYEYVENLATNHIVPQPGAENFRFNLWVIDPFSAPLNNEEVEVVINDFVYLPLLEGDFDNDGDVDSDDLGQWEGDFGQNRFSDADGDGDSDGKDFLAWQRNFSNSSSSTNMAVPEPSSRLLLYIAAFLLISVVPNSAPGASRGVL